MPRLLGSSVRERVMAIEGSGSKEFKEPAGIRTHYIPEVKHVNRRLQTTNLLTNEPSSSKRKDAAPMTSLPFLNRPAQVSYISPEDKDADNGVEKGNRKKKRNVTLPQLNNKSPRKAKKEKDFIERIEDQARVAVAKISSESDSSVKSISTGVRLNDHLSARAVNLHSAGKRTFASLGTRQNGIIINRPLQNPSLEVSLPPRSKSSQDLEARLEPSYAVPLTPSLGISISQSNKDLRDMATQTMILPISSQLSTTSVEFLDPAAKGTQTEAVPLVIVPRRKSEAPINLQDVRLLTSVDIKINVLSQIEEREALMEVIEDALGETFDRYSRIRTNQIIANSARKQAQIWRDAKDFLANQLFPQSIQLANMSTSRNRTAAEIVANIKIYP
ncbi:unnamed protein product [Caenorhabditis auriculariae]|uniref:Uncharacterized protein n=1 Tax=Caenorhabditis auriculariae TaxID=2777116 RepID=A0A8S1GQI3_9PELO|nr:unnamed protein product [Caenorhabditis auriculariae]